MHIRVEEYLSEGGESSYRKWFDSLDAQAAAKIATAKLRLELGIGGVQGTKESAIPKQGWSQRAEEIGPWH